MGRINVKESQLYGERHTLCTQNIAPLMNKTLLQMVVYGSLQSQIFRFNQINQSIIKHRMVHNQHLIYIDNNNFEYYKLNNKIYKNDIYKGVCGVRVGGGLCGLLSISSGCISLTVEKSNQCFFHYYIYIYLNHVDLL